MWVQAYLGKSTTRTLPNRHVGAGDHGCPCFWWITVAVEGILLSHVPSNSSEAGRKKQSNLLLRFIQASALPTPKFCLEMRERISR